MKVFCSVIALFTALLIVSGNLYAAEDLAKLESRIVNCDEILNEIMQMPDKSIPTDLLSKCSAVAVFPYVLKGGFFVGGRYGKGIVVAHDPQTGRWRPPVFFTVGGGSFGLQFGAQAIDLVLVIMNKRGLEGLLQDKFTLGGDASVAAGPVGRNASADTDLLLKAGIFSYSRSKGLFAGIAVKGAVIAPDQAANQTYYGGPVDVKELLFGNKIIPPASSSQLLKTLSTFSR
ncbi:MAG: lipid-binding SYLF domain-containing protein [Candidatus Omnitrophica bacterium]|nr:lipid-binding SYLF domain-containing protein [Candidatus Omnitrophota bacterium]